MSDPFLFVDRFLEVIFIFHWWEVDILQRRAYLVLNQGCHSQDFQVQVVLTTHSHIFPQVSLCLRARDNPALKVYVYLRTCRIYTPFSKSACTYEPGALPLFQVFEDLRTINNSPFFKPCTYEPGIFSVTNSSLLTTKDILRYPCLRITVRPSVESMAGNAGEGGGGLRLGRYVFLDQRSVTDWVGSSSCIYSERLGKCVQTQVT